MGIKYSCMSSIYPCLRINVCIYPNAFLNKLYEACYTSNKCSICLGRGGKEKKIHCKCSNAKGDSAATGYFKM